MTLSYSFPVASPTSPLLSCDCRGGRVYLRLTGSYKHLARDKHGVLRATIADRVMSTAGIWTYSFEVDEAGLITPLPTLTAAMIFTVCCQTCQGYADEAYNLSEFGGRLAGLVGGRYRVRHTIRPFLLNDWRVWSDTAPASLVEMDLFVDGFKVTSFPLKILAGQTMTQGRPQFLSGDTYRIREGALIEVGLVSYSVDLGLESWWFGHLDPGPWQTGSSGGGTDITPIPPTPPGTEMQVTGLLAGILTFLDSDGGAWKMSVTGTPGTQAGAQSLQPSVTNGIMRIEINGSPYTWGVSGPAGSVAAGPVSITVTAGIAKWTFETGGEEFTRAVSAA